MEDRRTRPDLYIYNKQMRVILYMNQNPIGNLQHIQPDYHTYQVKNDINANYIKENKTNTLKRARCHLEITWEQNKKLETEILI